MSESIEAGLTDDQIKLARALFEEIFTVRMSLIDETDRGCALMVMSYLDHALRRTIEANMVEDKNLTDELFGFSSALGSLSARINLAYGFGLIPKNIAQDLNLMRKVRNDFGHTFKALSFGSPGISDRCSHLSCHVKSAEEGPRTLFVDTAMSVLIALNQSALTAKRPEIPPFTFHIDKAEKLKIQRDHLVELLVSLPNQELIDIKNGGKTFQDVLALVLSKMPTFAATPSTTG